MIFNDNLPIYTQIMNLIKKKIVSEDLKGGEKLQSVRESSIEFKVNPNTIQRAYQELEREGLVFTQRGMGTFITEDIEAIQGLKKNMATNIINSFLVDMKSLGFTIDEVIESINNSEGELK